MKKNDIFKTFCLVAFLQALMILGFIYYAVFHKPSNLVSSPTITDPPSLTISSTTKSEKSNNNEPRTQIPEKEKKYSKMRKYNYFTSESGIPGWCESIDDYKSLLSFDPFNSYQAPSSLTELENPFQTCNSALNFSKILIPERAFSASLQTNKYGGFTADMGWIFMISRLALIERSTVEFPEYWGHGCYDEAKKSSWSCFFKPIIAEKCTKELDREKVSLVQENDKDRHRGKLKDIYLNKELIGARNEIFTNFVNGIRSDNDLQSMRILFSWTFRLQDSVRKRVDAVKKQVLKTHWKDVKKMRYLGVHIRGGDKIGHNAGGPVEAYYVPMKAYTEILLCASKFQILEDINGIQDLNQLDFIYIATDEYSELEKLVDELKEAGIKLPIYTSSTEEDIGFSVKSYRKQGEEKEKFDSSVGLWADMEILAESEIFVGNLQSNVGRTVHLMRKGKHPDSTLSVPLNQKKGRSCCYKGTGESFLTNCFWLCS
eukprot:snap_masked-scaffold_42-processed-gene-1.23-mRNA-1 protein AED:1.00 eAED:1.00 QI:0/-1/0/0/-1/1/1/0/486